MLSPPIPGCPGSNLASKKRSASCSLSMGRSDSNISKASGRVQRQSDDEKKNEPRPLRDENGLVEREEEDPKLHRKSVRLEEGGRTPGSRRAVDEARMRETTEGM